MITHLTNPGRVQYAVRTRTALDLKPCRAHKRAQKEDTPRFLSCLDVVSSVEVSDENRDFFTEQLDLTSTHDESKQNASHAEEEIMEYELSEIPPLHWLGKEHLICVKDKQGIVKYAAVPVGNEEEDKTVDDYFRHETVHLFGLADDAVSERAETATQRAMERSAKEEDIDTAMKAYFARDGIKGQDLPGTVVLDSKEIFTLISDEAIDEEIVSMATDRRVADVIRGGAPVRFVYFKELGQVEEKVVELFDTLFCSTDLKSLRDNVLALKPFLVRRHWIRFNEAVAKAISDVVRIEYGTGYYMTNFEDDIADLTQLIADQFGPGTPVTLAYLNDMPKKVAKRVSTLIEQDGTGTFVHVLPCVWQQLPITSHNLGFAIAEGKQFAYVAESRFPNLYTLIQNLLNQESPGREETEFFDVRMETSDGKAIHCHKAHFGDKLLISLS